MTLHGKPTKVNTFPALSPQHERAAMLVARGDSSLEEVARLLGINASTLWRWRQRPAFDARVQVHAQQLREDWEREWEAYRVEQRLQEAQRHAAWLRQARSRW